jgi:hypothetical protein
MLRREKPKETKQYCGKEAVLIFVINVDYFEDFN